MLHPGVVNDVDNSYEQLYIGQAVTGGCLVVARFYVCVSTAVESFDSDVSRYAVDRGVRDDASEMDSYRIARGETTPLWPCVPMLRSSLVCH